MFGEGNLSSAGADFIRVPPLRNFDDRIDKMASVFVTGSPANTWAGTIDVALGVEWRTVDASYKPDNRLNRMTRLPGIRVLGSTDPMRSSRSIPKRSSPWPRTLLGQVSGDEIGARYSDYEHADSFWTYKAGAEWRPFDSLRLRVMRQHSVRAPTIFDMFLEQSLYTWAITYDPCSALADPVGTGNADKCIAQGLPADQVGVFEAAQGYPVDFLDGGNLDLGPETGDTWTAGFVLTLSSLPNLSVAVDYFDFELEDTIGGLDSY